MRSMLSFALLASLCGAAMAQTTHLVGPGGYPQITNAIAAASPGDVILVQPGTYGMFIANIGLTIRATVPGAAYATLGFGGSVIQPPSGQTVHLVGMQLGLTVVTSGRATLDGCIIDTQSGQLAVTNAAVHVQACLLRSYAPSVPFWNPVPTLQATNADVTVIDSTILGADMVPLLTPGVAIDLIGSTFRGSHLALRAGHGSPAMPALRADAASRVWISDSTIDSDPTGCPIAATNGRHDHCLLTPNCSGIPSGFVLGIDRQLPLQNGGMFTLDLRAQPNSAIGVFISYEIVSSSHASLEQSLLLPSATASSGGVFVADGAGNATAAWYLPAGPNFVDRTVWFQAFAGPAFPLQASAIAGGIVR